MLVEGYIFPVGPWKNLTQKEKEKMKKKYMRLRLIGMSVKHYHQRKISDEITLVFSNNEFFHLVDDVEWAVQLLPEFLKRAKDDDNAMPEKFVLIPDLPLDCLMEIQCLIEYKGIEIHVFYRESAIYNVRVNDNGQLLVFRDTEVW